MRAPGPIRCAAPDDKYVPAGWEGPSYAQSMITLAIGPPTGDPGDVQVSRDRDYGPSVTGGHPLLEANVKSAIERAASGHLGRRWVSTAFTDLNDRASHPCGI